MNSPTSTTETRLIPHGTKLKTYDQTVYEEQLAYFNTATRVAFYSHNVKGEGIDNCYDCRSEIEILKQYLLKFDKDKYIYSGEIDEEKLNKGISQLSKKISTILSNTRTLESGTIRFSGYDARIKKTKHSACSDLLLNKNPNFKNK